MMASADLVLRSSLVLLAGAGALVLLRHQSAALRHWTLAIAIVLAGGQPLLRTAMPQWTLPALPAATAVAVIPERATPVSSSDITFEPVSPARTSAATLADGRLPTLLQRVWMAGATASLAVLLLGMLWLVWQTVRAKAASDRWRNAGEAVARDFGITRRVRILETEHPALLVTWGAFAPVILLPRGASAWPDDRIRLVLAHELAHLARRDWLVQLAAECIRAVYWFNPLFWMACARLRSESEQAADDRVLGLGIVNTSYASHLIDLARSFSVHGRTWLPAPSMARPSTLERRVVAMLNAQLNRQPVSWPRKWASAIVLLVVALPVAAAAIGAGTPSGVLRDPQGRVLPAATVRLSAIGAEAIHETMSGADGSFQFPEVPDGDYMISARLPGFMSSRQRVRVTANMPPLDLTLQVGTLKETITVRRAVGEVDGPPTGTTSARPAPAKPECGTTEVGGNIKPPMKLKDVRPRYKQALVDANLEGTVLLQAIIDTNGRVRNIEVVSPVNADLEESAINAVSQWEFSPTWLNCEAIEVRMFVNVSFQIDR